MCRRKERHFDEFIIGTEDGVMYELTKRYPEKTFYSVMEGRVCEDMKKVTLEKYCSACATGREKLPCPTKYGKKRFVRWTVCWN